MYFNKLILTIPVGRSENKTGLVCYFSKVVNEQTL